MIRPLRLLMFAAALTCAAVPVFAQSETIGPRDIWPAATAAADTGDFEAANQRLTQMLDLGRTLGIKRYPLYAQSAIALARQAHADGNPDLSNWAAATALKLDATSPTVAFSAADLARAQARWGAAASHVFAGLGNSFVDYRTSVITSANLVVVLAIVVTVATFAFALLLLIAYRRAAAHDFRELLGDRFSPGIASVLAFALLFLPLFLWLGPTWLVLYWYLIFFSYATLRERITGSVLLVLFALVPVMLSWSAYRTTGVNGPVLRAAIASDSQSYQPEAMRRMRELIEVLPEEARLHLLAGNLEVLEGNENAALMHYRRATELDNRLAGAYLNAGNLRFLHNDFPAAMLEYQNAAEKDPEMAIAYYNRSVTAGETYKFDEQGRQLALAKKYDRSLVERILKRPPQQKVVQYQLPLDEAWRLSDSITRRKVAKELFANYARFDLLLIVGNAATIGSIVALAAGLLLANRRRKSGRAGACIKCGRTFCPKCKSARESATYCTQCIHIYLKRDGVSIDTKRSKLEEVQEFQADAARTRKILATFLPGSARVLEGATIRGLISIALFALFVTIAVLIGRLAPISTPAVTVRLVIQIVAIVAAVVTWIMTAVPVYRQRTAA